MHAVGKFLVILSVVLALGVGFAAVSTSENTDAPDEQRHFSAEDAGVRRPVPVPRGVVETLMKSETVKDLIGSSDPPLRRIPGSWLSASIIHLAGAKEPDLIVQGAGAVLGANVTTFWIFRQDAKGYSMILEVTAHDLIVEGHSTNDILDVETTSATATHLFTSYFKFSRDQGQYVEVKSIKEMIGDLQ